MAVSFNGISKDNQEVSVVELCNGSWNVVVLGTFYIFSNKKDAIEFLLTIDPIDPVYRDISTSLNNDSPEEIIEQLKEDSTLSITGKFSTLGHFGKVAKIIGGIEANNE